MIQVLKGNLHKVHNDPARNLLVVNCRLVSTRSQSLWLSPSDNQYIDFKGLFQLPSTATCKDGSKSLLGTGSKLHGTGQFVSAVQFGEALWQRYRSTELQNNLKYLIHQVTAGHLQFELQTSYSRDKVLEYTSYKRIYH